MMIAEDIFDLDIGAIKGKQSVKKLVKLTHHLI